MFSVFSIKKKEKNKDVSSDVTPKAYLNHLQ